MCDIRDLTCYDPDSRDPNKRNVELARVNKEAGQYSSCYAFQGQNSPMSNWFLFKGLEVRDRRGHRTIPVLCIEQGLFLRMAPDLQLQSSEINTLIEASRGYEKDVKPDKPLGKEIKDLWKQFVSRGLVIGQCSSERKLEYISLVIEVKYSKCKEFEV